MEKLHIIDLLQQSIIRPAELAPANMISREEIEKLEGIRFSLINHDYPANAPRYWNAAYRELLVGNFRYIMFVAQPEHLAVIMAAFKSDPRVIGGGAGSGFKDKIIHYVDELDPAAEAIGSINVIRRENTGAWRGYNLDGVGYGRSLEEKFQERKETLAGKKVVIIGAGGTGGPIAFALAEMGMRVIVLNRTIEKAEQLQMRFNQYFGRDLIKAGGLDQVVKELIDADAVVSTIDDKMSSLDAYSSLGTMGPQINLEENKKSAAEVLGRAKPTLIVSDVRLRDQKVEMLKQAEELGFTTLDGKSMARNVAIEGFWLLHGKELQAKNVTKGQVAEVMKRAASS